MIKFTKKTISVITYVEGNQHLWNYDTGNSECQDQGKHFTFYLIKYKIKFSQADKNNVSRWQTPGPIFGQPILTLGLLLTTMIKWQNILLNALKRKGWVILQNNGEQLRALHIE